MIQKSADGPKVLDGMGHNKYNISIIDRYASVTDGKGLFPCGYHNGAEVFVVPTVWADSVSGSFAPTGAIEREMGLLFLFLKGEFRFEKSRHPHGQRKRYARS